MNFINDWRVLVPLAILLGLMPFFPKPLRWVAGGAHGVQAMDWLDLLWHAFSIVLLMRSGILRMVKKRVNDE